MKLVLRPVWGLWAPRTRGRQNSKRDPTPGAGGGLALLTWLRSSASPCPSAAFGYSGQSPTGLTGGVKNMFIINKTV